MSSFAAAQVSVDGRARHFNRSEVRRFCDHAGIAAIFLPGICIAMNYDNPLLAIIGSLLSVAAMAVFLINFRRNYDAADPSSLLADSLAISARRPVV